MGILPPAIRTDTNNALQSRKTDDARDSFKSFIERQFEGQFNPGGGGGASGGGARGGGASAVAIAAAMATTRLRSRQRRRMISRRLIMITIPLSISSTTGPDCNSFRRFFFFYSSAAFSVHVLATWHIVSLPIP